ncbi:MAG: c-type cytochrome, partial [Akkermansiaceae bacterium]|nr:c-type cytochrome [Akkermansiaceae bacterium]
GRCGASAPGEVGRPGTPAADRIPLRGTIWRYHPRTRVFEALSCGCTNPWGHDWDRHGQLFFINTVNGHFWHHITGNHMKRSHTIDPNPHSYQLMDHHADHWHFDTTGGWGKSRHGAANEFGGGHAHIGMIIYQGDNWPEEYRHNVYTVNMHGKRINREILERRGSGYVAKHAPDFLIAKDPFFRALELTTGPDGGVFLLDWSDTGECHENTGVHRTSGRIYKITHSRVRKPGGGIADNRVLYPYCSSPNAWHYRMKVLEIRDDIHRLEDAGPAGARDLQTLRTRIRRPFESIMVAGDPAVRLRKLWALHQFGALEPEELPALLGDPREHVRVWAIRLLTDHFPLDTVEGKRREMAPEIVSAIRLASEFSRMAEDDGSALVRLTLASTMQRLPLRLRTGVAKGLVSHPGDAGDHNLPLMIWYGLAPVAEKFPDDLVEVAAGCALPLVRKFIARRLAEDIETNPKPIDALLAIAAEKPAAFQRDILAGLTEAFRGWQKAPAPASWPKLSEAAAKSPDPHIRQPARDLAVLFGDGRALDEVKRIALDGREPVETRKAALRSLIKARHPELKEICMKLVETRFLNVVAAKGLTLFDDPAAAGKLAGSFRRFHHSEYHLAIEALVSRPVFAAALLDQIAAGKIPRSRLTAFHARQIRSFHDDALTAKLSAVWGDLRDTPSDKKRLIEVLKQQLDLRALAAADLGEGRKVYNQICSSCHKLHGEGKSIGPDLTGSGRSNLDYLLGNIIDPGAEVSADYRMTVVTLKDGRTLNGFIRSQNKKTLTLQTMTDAQTLAKEHIAGLEPLPVSLMPAGLLDTLTSKQQRDLLAYLMHPTQVPLP